MALFKIFKGSNYERLLNPALGDDENTGFIKLTDGYCYFEINSGLFYVDAKIQNISSLDNLSIFSQMTFRGNGDYYHVYNGIELLYAKKQSDNTYVLFKRAPINSHRAVTDVNGDKIDLTYVKKDDYNPCSINYGECSTSTENVMKEVSLENFDNQDNNLLLIKFTNDVSANSKLQINNDISWKNIKLCGNNITNNVIQAGATCLFRVVGSDVELVAIDKDIQSKANLDSPAFEGTPTAPTAEIGNNTTQIATTAFISNAIQNLRGDVSEDFDTLAKIQSKITNLPQPGNATLTIKKNGDEITTFSANATTDVEANIIVPTPGAGILTIKKNGNTVTTFSANATINAEADITVPAPGNGVLTITTNGSSIGTFSANTAENKTINIPVANSWTDGLMDALDKEKLDGIADNANNYKHPKPLSSDYTTSGLYKIKINQQGHITEATKFENYAGSISEGGPANSVANAVSFYVGGVSKGSYDGSSPVRVEVNAVDLNISGPLRYIGRTPTVPNSQTIVLVQGTSHSANSGDVVICTANNYEYLYDDNEHWIQLGAETSYALSLHTHGNISSQGFLTDSDGTPILNSLIITGNDGQIVNGPAINTDAVSSVQFLNEKGTWRSVAWNDISSKPSLAASNHVHSTNDITSGVLPIARGGTGESTAINAANMFINNLQLGTATSVPADNDYFVSQYKNGGTTYTNYYRRPFARIWDYVRDKAALKYIDNNGQALSNQQSNYASKLRFDGIAASLYQGPTAPTDSAYTVWIDTSEDSSSGGDDQVVGNILDPGCNIKIGNTTKHLNGAQNLTWTASEIGYVPTTGGTYTGDITLQKSTSIANNYPAKLLFKTIQSDNNITNSSSAYIAVYDDHDANAYGQNMVIQSAGNMIIGGGESPNTLYTNVINGTNKDTGESMYISSDNEINFYTGCDTWANRKETVKITAAGVLYGAAWNDYAEYRIADSTEPGRCVVEAGDDTLTLSNTRMQPGAAVISDTFGFAIGEAEEAQTPIAVSGRVLAYGLESLDEFKSAIGRPVCSGPNGTVSIMTDEEYQQKGYCAIGTISAVPTYGTWGQINIPVNGRVWIKVI